MKQNIKIAKQLIRIAKDLLVADNEKKVQEELSKINFKDAIRNPEKAIEQIQEKIDDKDFDKLVKQVKASFYKHHRIVAFNKNTKMNFIAKSNYKVNSNGLMQKMNEKDIEKVHMTAEKNFQIKGDKIIINDISGNKVEFELKEYVQFIGTEVYGDEQEIERICYNFTQKEKDKIVEKITKTINGEDYADFRNELFDHQKELIKKIKDKDGNLGRIKKVIEFVSKKKSFITAGAIIIIAILGALGIGKGELMNYWSALGCMMAIPTMLFDKVVQGLSAIR